MGRLLFLFFAVLRFVRKDLLRCFAVDDGDEEAEEVDEAHRIASSQN